METCAFGKAPMSKGNCNTPFLRFMRIAILDYVQDESELRMVRFFSMRDFIVRILPTSYISIFKFVCIALSRFEWFERELVPKSLIQTLLAN